MKNLQRSSVLGFIFAICGFIGLYALFFLVAQMFEPDFFISRDIISAQALAFMLSGTVLVITSMSLICSAVQSCKIYDKWIFISLFLVFLLNHFWAGIFSNESFLFFLGRDLILLACSFLFGYYLGEKIEKKSWVLSVIVVASIIDVWNIQWGVGKLLIEKPQVHMFFLLNYPVFGYSTPQYILGIGDFMFVTAYLYVAQRFALGLRKTAAALCCAFILILAIASVSEFYLPALPLLGLIFYGMHYRQFVYSMKDFQITVGFVFILIAILGALTFLL